jgi:hypothetical protein
MIEFIDGHSLKKMFISAAVTIDGYKEEINELNVFPVPDGDTGSNMSMTIGNAMAELQKQEPEKLCATADIAASALLRGARGNSGVILSLLFRGFAKYMKDKASANASEMANAFLEGVNTAYKSVMKPTEGTILTVSRLASEAAVSASEESSDIEFVLSRMIEAGEAALADTVNQNPVLKKANVIDAGGKGYMIIIQAMLDSLLGKEVEISAGAAPAVKAKADFSDFNTEDIKFAYCTEFIIGRENNKDPQLLRVFLDALGDSIVVVDDEEIIKVHVHNNCPGKVITEALTYGHLISVKIENMRLQHTEVIGIQQEEEPAVAKAEKAIGVVAVCAGAGLEDMFRELGADGVISGGQTMNPSTEDILKEINKTPSETVFVLPNNKNIVLAAEQCVGMTEKNVVVIPTATVPQGVSAMIALDPEAGVEDIEAAMKEAAGLVHTVTLTYAARNSNFDDAEIKEGDYLALLENKLLCTGSDLDAISSEISDTIARFEPELISVYYGEDVSEDDANALAKKLEAENPDAEITVVNGGQPVYYYIISAE